MPDYVCRRLILFLDGTWNEDTEDHPATSIVYLRERLFWGLQIRLREKFPIDHEEFEKLNDFKRKGISGLVLDGFEYIVYYDRGVGTGPFLDPLKGGVFGERLAEKIREAYRFFSLRPARRRGVRLRVLARRLYGAQPRRLSAGCRIVALRALHDRM
jgi:hypothetical protein